MFKNNWKISAVNHLIKLIHQNWHETEKKQQIINIINKNNNYRKIRNQYALATFFGSFIERWAFQSWTTRTQNIDSNSLGYKNCYSKKNYNQINEKNSSHSHPNTRNAFEILFLTHITKYISSVYVFISHVRLHRINVARWRLLSSQNTHSGSLVESQNYSKETTNHQPNHFPKQYETKNKRKLKTKTHTQSMRTSKRECVRGRERQES